MVPTPLKRLLPAAVLVLAAFVSTLSHADRNRWLPRDEGRQEFAPGSMRDERISLERAIDTVQRSTGGKVLDARSGNGEYRIKVLTRRGEVRVVYVDARTGQMR
ncbi:MAG TPA: hypothetical protein VFB54_20665 [Burkholderiales bacterium]|nr:hypothetical protein [Burkholderiales bacterium]